MRLQYRGSSRISKMRKWILPEILGSSKKTVLRAEFPSKNIFHSGEHDHASVGTTRKSS